MLLRTIALTIATLVTAQAPAGGGHAILGGTFEASGVAAVPGTSGVLFVNDAMSDAVLWMELDSSGAQKGEAVFGPDLREIGDASARCAGRAACLSR